MEGFKQIETRLGKDKGDESVQNIMWGGKCDSYILPIVFLIVGYLWNFIKLAKIYWIRSYGVMFHVKENIFRWGWTSKSSSLHWHSWRKAEEIFSTKLGFIPKRCCRFEPAKSEFWAFFPLQIIELLYDYKIYLFPSLSTLDWVA